MGSKSASRKARAARARRKTPTPNIAAARQSAIARSVTVNASHGYAALNTHADLTARWSNPSEELKYSHGLNWGGPDVALSLTGARTYQIAEEMVTLAEGLSAQQQGAPALDPDEVPYKSGFMWLDRPITVMFSEDINERRGKKLVSVARAEPAPLEIQAFTWMLTEAIYNERGTVLPRYALSMARQLGAAGLPAEGDEVWQAACILTYWTGIENIRGGAVESRRQVYGSVFPCGWLIFPGSRANEEDDRQLVQFVRATWALMGMPFTHETAHALTRGIANHARRSGIEYPAVRIVKLRRTGGYAHSSPGERAAVDWSCRWLVRGHRRHYACELCQAQYAAHDNGQCPGELPQAWKGRSIWIAPYIKGPDGRPLKTGDVLYLLGR